jgi:hypothetical protein
MHTWLAPVAAAVQAITAPHLPSAPQVCVPGLGVEGAQRTAPGTQGGEQPRPVTHDPGTAHCSLCQAKPPGEEVQVDEKFGSVLVGSAALLPQLVRPAMGHWSGWQATVATAAAGAEVVTHEVIPGMHALST